MLTLPGDAEVVDLSRPEQAVAELAASLLRIRNTPSLSAEAEVLARQMIDEAVRAGGYLLALLPDGAVLTGASAPSAPEWDKEHANALRWQLDDTSHETVTVDTPLGPVVLAERRTVDTVRLQAFLAEPGRTEMLVVTLTARSPRGWPAHRTAFLGMLHTATSTVDCRVD
jgi:hypothetical protein